MRLADPLRDFSQPSVEPCVAYVSDPLPMAGPDDPVLLSFETSADRSDNPLGVVEPVGDFYALAKGRPLPLPRHCDVHGTIYAIRRHLLHAVNQGARKIVLISLHLDKSVFRWGLGQRQQTLTALPAAFAPSARPPHAIQRQTRRSNHDERCNLHGNSWNKSHKNHSSGHTIPFGGILHILARYGGPQDLYRTIRRFVKLPH